MAGLLALHVQRDALRSSFLPGLIWTFAAFGGGSLVRDPALGAASVYLGAPVLAGSVVAAVLAWLGHLRYRRAKWRDVMSA
jgi:hypothetical protein